jgi:hypothetical protein
MLGLNGDGKHFKECVLSKEDSIASLAVELLVPHRCIRGDCLVRGGNGVSHSRGQIHQVVNKMLSIVVVSG